VIIVASVDLPTVLEVVEEVVGEGQRGWIAASEAPMQRQYCGLPLDRRDLEIVGAPVIDIRAMAVRVRVCLLGTN
jgi:hypothetical protein